MKYIYMVAIMMSLSMVHVSSADYYQSLCNGLMSMGRAIEGVDNVPVVGKLTNLLPFSVLASSLKECPMQTVVVLTIVGAYIFSYNNPLSPVLKKYELVNKAPWIRKKRAVTESNLDDSFFTYDEDEEENESIEDDLLNSDLFDSEDEQTKQRKQAASAQSQ